MENLILKIVKWFLAFGEMKTHYFQIVPVFIPSKKDILNIHLSQDILFSYYLLKVNTVFEYILNFFIFNIEKLLWIFYD